VVELQHAEAGGAMQSTGLAGPATWGGKEEGRLTDHHVGRTRTTTTMGEEHAAKCQDAADACQPIIRLSTSVPSKFFPIYHFLRHIINISPPKFSSPAAVLSILSPYTPLQL
jgi:hypothetical protein